MATQDYNGYVPPEDVIAERVDERGRPHVQLMSERMLIEETVVRLRQLHDGLEQFTESVAANPMMKNLLGM